MHHVYVRCKVPEIKTLINFPPSDQEVLDFLTTAVEHDIDTCKLVTLPYFGVEHRPVTKMPPIRPISPFLDEATTSYVWSADDQDLHVDGQVLRLSIGVAVSDGNGNSDSRDDHAQSSVTNSQRHASLTETEPDHASLSPASEPGGTSPSSPRDAESERMAAPPRPDGQTTPSPGSTTDASSELHEPTGGSPPVAWAPRHVSSVSDYRNLSGSRFRSSTTVT